MSCKRELLSECEHASLERCACGTVHLSMGPLSLKLSPHIIAELASAFATAARKLDRSALEMMEIPELPV